MNAKELREAAILLHDWCFDSTIKYQDCEHPWDAHLNDFDLDDAILKALEPVLAHILANVQEDGEDEPTPSWIEENFPVSESGNGFYRIGGLYFAYSGASWHCCRHRTTQSVICPITTRLQFRSLMTGLGLSKLVKPLDEVSSNRIVASACEAVAGSSTHSR